MIPELSSRLLSWFDNYGRKNLPWQKNILPWRVWVSEIMLQQTQVSTVIPYFERFMQRFADIQALARASEDEILHLWTGLGYYSRARNLLKTAKIIAEELDGVFPDSLAALQTLPGIGRSTAGAILAIGFGKKAVILDGNVKRVLTRLYGIDSWPGEKKTEARLWEIAHELTPDERVADYTQAIMDLGATVCVRGQPVCVRCPFVDFCIAHQKGIEKSLPVARRRLPLPQRYVTLLVIRNKKNILLEKRPASGVWGGLWSLPEVPGKVSVKTIQAHCEKTLCFMPKKIIRGESFRHVFTHFSLEIHPVFITQADAGKLSTDEKIWYNLARPQTIGLPAPVKKLLDILTCHA